MLHLFFSKKIVLVRKEGNLYFHLCSNSKIHALTNNLISFLIEMELCVTNVILVKGRLGNSLFRSFALRSVAHFLEQLWANIRSLRSFQKIDCEQIPLISLYKRATWANRSGRSLKKSTVSDSLMIWVNRAHKRAICSLCPRANRSRGSSLICSF